MKKDETAALAAKMLARADQDKLPEDHPLRRAARHFNDSATGFLGDPQTATVRQFVSSWARARLAWREYSGEELMGG